MGMATKAELMEARQRAIVLLLKRQAEELVALRALVVADEARDALFLSELREWRAERERSVFSRLLAIFEKATWKEKLAILSPLFFAAFLGYAVTTDQPVASQLLDTIQIIFRGTHDPTPPDGETLPGTPGSGGVNASG